MRALQLSAWIVAVLMSMVLAFPAAAGDEDRVPFEMNLPDLVFAGPVDSRGNLVTFEEVDGIASLVIGGDVPVVDVPVDEVVGRVIGSFDLPSGASGAGVWNFTSFTVPTIGLLTVRCHGKGDEIVYWKCLIKGEGLRGTSHADGPGEFALELSPDGGLVGSASFVLTGELKCIEVNCGAR